MAIVLKFLLLCLESDLRARQALSDMGRIELEDKYLRLLEEMFVRSTSCESRKAYDFIMVLYQVLKKHARSQEDKMKRMATKLLRLTADEKKEMHREIHPLTSESVCCGVLLSSISALIASQLRQRDVETEEFIGDLQHRIRELEKQTSSLKGKVLCCVMSLWVHCIECNGYSYPLCEVRVKSSFSRLN